MRFSRRQFLAASAATAGLAATAWPLRIQAADTVRIDSHAHIFNACDIPVDGFVRKILVGSLADYGWVGKVANYFARLVGSVLKDIAPTYEEEDELLDSDGAVWAGQVMAYRIVEYYDGLIKRYFDLPIGERRSIRQKFRDEVAREIDKQKSGQEVDGRLPELDLNKIDFDGENMLLRFLLLAREHAQQEHDDSEKVRLYRKRTALLRFFDRLPGARFIRFGERLASYRLDNALRYLDQYGDQIDVFVGANVDFNYWLDGDRATTTAEQQISLLSRISLLTNGKMLPMIGYNPWPDVIDPDYFGNLAAGVTEGIVGIKMYPPMGFRPYFNTQSDLSFPKACPAAADLDAKLLKAYIWCRENDIAILAHASPTLGADADYALRADPVFWDRLLTEKGFELNGLRLSLAHVGGFDSVVNNDRWFQRAVTAGRRPNVFLDFGAFKQIRTRKNQQRMKSALDRLIKSNNDIARQLCFATDWFMIAKERDSKNYIDDFEQMLGGDYEQMLGSNAAYYLGLHQACGVYERADSFFGLSKPDWFGKPTLQSHRRPHCVNL